MKLPDVALGLLYPLSVCVACGGRQDVTLGLCGPCLNMLPELLLTIDQREASDEGRAYGLAIGAYAYRGCAAGMIRTLKFHGEARPALAYLAPVMASWARKEGFVGRIFVPVPLSRRKMAERGYNQAAVLALRIARETGAFVREGWLWRKRDTKNQADLDEDRRETNVRGAFEASSAAKGKDIALIDDVLTTGATCSACAQAFLEAGARSVNVLAATRAVMGDEPR